MRGKDFPLQVLYLETLFLLVDGDGPAGVLQCLGGDVRTAIDDLGLAKKRALRVLHRLKDVVSERWLAGLAAKVMIGVPELASLQRLGLFGSELLNVDVLEVSLGRRGQSNTRGLEELDCLAGIAVDGAVRLVVDDQVEVERRELLTVATICHQRLDGRHHHRRTEQLSGTAGGLVNHRLVFGKDDVEVLHCLFGEFDAVYDEQHALGIARLEEATDQRGAEERLACAGRHFQQEPAATVFVVAPGNFFHGANLVATQGKVGAQFAEVFGADDFGLKRARWL